MHFLLIFHINCLKLSYKLDKLDSFVTIRMIRKKKKKFSVFGFGISMAFEEMWHIPEVKLN